MEVITYTKMFKTYIFVNLNKQELNITKNKLVKIEKSNTIKCCKILPTLRYERLALSKGRKGGLHFE